MAAPQHDRRPTRKRMGRPPRIDRDAIARAVLELGFDDVTMKSVAERLGVSVPGLYHHVNGKDELIRLAADHQLSSVELPTFRGQDWETWLREWARYSYGAMSAQPELFELYLTDGLDAERMVDVIAEVVERLVAQGFTARTAYEAWTAVSITALGSAALTIRQRAEEAAGGPWRIKLQQALIRRESAPPEVLLSLSDAIPRRPDDEFERQLDLAIATVRERLAPSDRVVP